MNASVRGGAGCAPHLARGATRAAHARGVRLISICTGAFVLAEAGLLDGRRATTHWIDVPEFKARYPMVEIDADVLYVDAGDILSSAGVAAGLDLRLYVVRRDFGPALANTIARRLKIAPHRTGGQAQFIAQPVSDESGHALEPVRAWMLGRLADPSVTVPVMAARAALPLRTFVRHFVQEVGVPPLQWLLRQRLLAAQRLPETSDLSVERVALQCGFGSAIAMRTHFRKTLDTSPLAYRRTFRVSGAMVAR